MKKQRGIIAMVWLYAAAAIAIMLALTALVVAWNKYTTKLDKVGYDRGVAVTTAAFQVRDNAQLQAVIVAQRAAEVRATKAEAEKAAADSLAASNYSKGVKDGKAKTAVLVAAAQSGALRLRDPGSQTGACPAGGSGTGSSQTASGTSGSNGTAGAYLSAEASGLLLALTGEADEVVRQLTAAQAVIQSDRVLCNAP